MEGDRERAGCSVLNVFCPDSHMQPSALPQLVLHSLILKGDTKNKQQQQLMASTTPSRRKDSRPNS